MLAHRETVEVHTRTHALALTVQAFPHDVVTAFAHDVKACALGQASSSIMGRNIIGSTIEELREVRDAASRLLKADGKAPRGKWEELEVLEPLRDYKARHASILLTFDAVVDALDQIEARRTESA